MNKMLRLLPSKLRDDTYAATDRVMLSDGQLMEVPRANLAAAKALLAAEKATDCRPAAEREYTASRPVS